MGRMIEYLDSSKQPSLEKAIKAIELNEAETLVSKDSGDNRFSDWRTKYSIYF